MAGVCRFNLPMRPRPCTVIQPLAASLAAVDFWLLIAGGLVYSAGVVFYVIERIPYHKAIWHGFVLTAAALQFVQSRMLMPPAVENVLGPGLVM